ncbi:MAG TPA: SgcJ/EcaC family oxidoreductase [Gemmatimonadaceae bacterium]|nr:SgcJ/EcaC family oxidoreductase [Gemmatimonadaceae bacterium]
MLRFLGLMLVLGARTACAQTGSPTPSGAMTAIVAADSEWLDAMRQHDAARIVAPYDDDAVFITGDGTAIRGRDRIADLYRTRFHKIVRVLDGGIVQEGTRAVNDSLVFEWGHGGLTYTDSTSAEHASYGPYLTVWRRNRTGKWLIVRNLVF